MNGDENEEDDDNDDNNTNSGAGRLISELVNECEQAQRGELTNCNHDNSLRIPSSYTYNDGGCDFHYASAPEMEFDGNLYSKENNVNVKEMIEVMNCPDFYDNMQVEKRKNINQDADELVFMLRDGFAVKYAKYFDTGENELIEYTVEFAQKPFGIGFECATGNKRGAIVDTLEKPDLESFVLFRSVIFSINGKPCGKHTYESILRKLDQATLPCKIRFLFQESADGEEDDKDNNNSNDSMDSGKNKSNKNNTCNRHNGKKQDIKYSLSSLCDDLISEISEYFNFYDFTVCDSILSQKIYDASYLNKRNIKQLHIDYIVSFLYEWIPHVDYEARAIPTATCTVYLRDLIYIQAFGGENVIKKHLYWSYCTRDSHFG